MKKLLILLGVLISSTAFSQSTTTPDTVCVGAVGENYWVTNTAGSNYDWTVSGGGGSISGGQGTSAVTIDWGNTPGLFPLAIEVIETNANGCTDTVELDIFILLPTFTQIGPFCEGDPCVALVGSPVGGVWTGTSVTMTAPGIYEFCPTSSGTLNLTYTVGGCSIVMQVVVNPLPVIGPIFHN
jgi:large repetitive protein